MSLRGRLRKLEAIMKSKNIDIILVDSSGNQVKGEVVSMPTEAAHGVARLPDGSERAILYEANWRDTTVMVNYTDEPQEPDDKLRLRREDVKHIAVSYVGPEGGVDQ